ncbi:thioester domain-containing protein [Allonocardiopsis opalescens]|uniref:thioester domain-containing protein n=1 Tax=Allonocardiopsis opalescens TaxID=1144618 RepID=UPI0014760EA9|nr:thioester domain-containing protein [Allonocardiopsis opalescens]
MATTLAATATALFLGAGLAAPAMADEEPPPAGVTGDLLESTTPGTDVNFGGEADYATHLFQLELSDGTVVEAYCIDINQNTNTEVPYVEGSWGDHPQNPDFEANADRVHWILQNSYPTVDDLGAIAEAAGTDSLTLEQVIGATQAAIWHFADGRDLAEGNDAGVIALYEYLTGEANTGLPSGGEPTASLSITPATAEGTAGSDIGEFTVATTADEVPLTVEGAEGVEVIVDGAAASAVANGGTFAVRVPEGTEAGAATVSGEVSATANLGRIFRSANYDPNNEDTWTQTLILAQTTNITAQASVSVTWDDAPAPSPSPSPSDTPSPSPSPSDTPSETPSPTPSDTPAPPSDDDDLPVTGSQIGILAAVAALLIGGGGAAMMIARKRRAAAAGLDADS